MLEDRLNKTYSSHMVGFSLPPQASYAQPPSSNPYPTLQSEAPAYNPSSGAESFYTGRPAPAPSDPYQRPQSTYGNYNAQQAPSQSYSQDQSYPPQNQPYNAKPQPEQSYPPQNQPYTAQPGFPTPQQQRAPSITYASSQPSGSPQIQRRISAQHVPSQPLPQGQYTPSQPPDPAAGYGFNNQAPQDINHTATAAPEPQASPRMYHQLPPQQAPPPQPQAMPTSPPLQQQQYGGQQAPYPTSLVGYAGGVWQQPVGVGGAGGAGGAGDGGGGGGYGSFPSVPQGPPVHVAPKVEEALIEL
jgi:growth factor-regulated tyrosine kinase substrate